MNKEEKTESINHLCDFLKEANRIESVVGVMTDNGFTPMPRDTSDICLKMNKDRIVNTIRSMQFNGNDDAMNKEIKEAQEESKRMFMKWKLEELTSGRLKRDLECAHKRLHNITATIAIVSSIVAIAVLVVGLVVIIHK